MPWKGEKNPYRIWLSEIILQQTRVEQGLAYYNRFIAEYPSVHDLAEAEENDVFKLWEGLGYYTRCRNMISTARFISNELKGNFPSDYPSILKLKGIGPYTAAAIGSFAFNLPYAVIDGNVIRVLARFFGISSMPGSVEGKKIFTELSAKLLEIKKPGEYNQAIMDFGATICKPRLPSCLQCILSPHCIAFNENLINQLPARPERMIRRHRWFYYIVFECNNHFFVRKRIEKDIWQNLFEFFLIEYSTPASAEELLASDNFSQIKAGNYDLILVSPTYKQQLTHQTIEGFFIHIKLKKIKAIAGFELVEKTMLRQLPFPGFITSYFAQSRGYFGYEILNSLKADSGR